MQTYRSVPMEECHDPLVPIPSGRVVVTEPHPYVLLGASYGEASPWMLRRGVLDALLAAQDALEARQPGWRLKLFDAYRPVAVQAFMVWSEFRRLAALADEDLMDCAAPADLQFRLPDLYDRLAPTVFEFWALPSDDPRTPPPHSTGAAIDLTLQDAAGREVDMGSPIDETTERSHPDYYARATSPQQAAFHKHRELLNDVMTSAGFRRHGNEWWHFSRGDQMWAWTEGAAQAFYGRVE
ncbi:MAG: D-alanyl-D-alanine dipeptidase [Rhodocyclaceae bacterium]|nr:D-alanyl-D-alanine dipeptidase [Rhodocyclaceae bacterium]